MSARRAADAARARASRLAPVAALVLSACAASAPPDTPVKAPPMSRPYPPKRVETPPPAPTPSGTPDPSVETPASGDEGKTL